MFCSNCGKEIGNSAKFCQYCGSKVNNEEHIVPESNTVDCSVCGKIFSISKYKYCPHCTANYVSIDKRIDVFKCGQYDKAESEGKCIYKPYCIHSDCQYSNNKNNSVNKFWLWFAIILGIIYIIAQLSIIVGIFIPDANDNKHVYKQAIETQQKQTVSSNVNSHTEEQRTLQKSEQLVEDAKKGGLIIRFKQAFVGDMAEEQPNVYICVVDEYVWNQLPHETKQQMVLLMEDYSKIKDWKIISFEGYRTGKSILNAVYAVKNFKL